MTFPPTPTTKDVETKSYPADPQRKSLLTLPAEVRNLILDLLVTSSEPIYIARHHVHEDRIGIYADAHNGFLKPTHQPGLALSVSCKQMYHEMISRLIQNNNRFIVTESCKHTELPADSIVNAAKWLTSMGSQIRYLRRFEVDSAALRHTAFRKCHTRAYEGEREDAWIDVTSLMHVLWRHQDLKFNLTYTVFHVRNKCRQQHQQPQDLDCGAFTWAIRAVQHDKGMLRKVWRGISLLALKWDFSRRGVIMSGTTNPQYADDTDGALLPAYTEEQYEFFIDNLRRVQVTKVPQHPPVLDSELPRHIISKIWADRVLSNEVIKIGTEDDYAIEDLMKSMEINFAIYRRLRTSYLLENEFVIEVHTTKTVAALPDFKNVGKIGTLIRELTRGDAGLGDAGLYGDQASQNPWEGVHNFPKVLFNLVFDLNKSCQDAELDDVYFDAFPLVHLLLDVKPDKKFRISISHHDKTGDLMAATMTVRTLRRKVCRAWNKLKADFTARVAAKWGDASHDQRIMVQSMNIMRSFPVIWMNGKGQVIDARFLLETTPGLSDASACDAADEGYVDGGMEAGWLVCRSDVGFGVDG